VRRAGDDDPPHILKRGVESIEDVVERRQRPFAAISSVGALIAPASARPYRARCSFICPSKVAALSRRVCRFGSGIRLQPPGPTITSIYGLETFVDLAAPNPLGRLGVERAQRNRRPSRREPRLEIRRQLASGLNENEGANEVGKILRHPESDMPSPGVTEQMDRLSNRSRGACRHRAGEPEGKSAVTLSFWFRGRKSRLRRPLSVVLARRETARLAGKNAPFLDRALSTPPAQLDLSCATDLKRLVPPGPIASGGRSG
jgi:hypothetical protein